MVTKYFVHAGGRWRELSFDGRVSGWGGKIRFLCMKRGRLCVVNTSSVLGGLRSLASCRPTTVKDGLPLSQIRREPRRKEPKKQEQRCCWEAHNQSFEKRNSGMDARVVTADIAVQASIQEPLEDRYNNNVISENTSKEKEKETSRVEKSQSQRNVKMKSHSTQTVSRKRRRSTSSGSSSDFVESSKQRKLSGKTREQARRKSENEVNEARARSKTPTYKELTVYREDLVVLRSFLAKNNVWNVNLRKFDKDDEYKMVVLYKITPVVTVARCPQISKMLRTYTQNNISLKDFTATLGLKQVSTSHSKREDKENRVKTRRSQRFKRSKLDSGDSSDSVIVIDSRHNVDSRRKNNNNRARDRRKIVNNNNRSRLDSQSSDDSENVSGRLRNRTSIAENKQDSGSSDEFKPDKRKRDDSNHDIKNNVDSQKSTKNKKSVSANRKRDDGNDSGIQSKILRNNKNNSRNTLDSGSDVDSDKTMLPEASSTGKKQDGEATKNFTKRKNNNKRFKPLGREYSMLEDQAIVAWLSTGSRATMVNGNRVWRELQTTYPNLTGQERSWHSLRNRYLRYVLPALGNLALPQAQAARLRAAAANGELKSRKRPPLPHPLLSLPPIKSAWGARPRSPIRDTSPEPAREVEDTRQASPVGRVLRSNLPEEEPAAETPLYSQLSSRYAHPESQSPTRTVSATSTTTASTSTGRTRKLYNPKSAVDIV